MDLNTFATLLGQGSTGIAALALGAVVWLYVDARRTADARLAEARSDAAAQLALAEKIVPLATQLVDAVSEFRRATEHCRRQP